MMSRVMLHSIEYELRVSSSSKSLGDAASAFVLLLEFMLSYYRT
jgi:hypothetical protein